MPGMPGPMDMGGMPGAMMPGGMPGPMDMGGMPGGMMPGGAMMPVECLVQWIWAVCLEA